MTWFQLKDKQFPQKGSWVLIRSSQKHVPKYEVCIYDGGEWFIPAYDDSAGITSDFNLNLLRRINGELEANFDVSSFTHEARWNEDASRIEMHLVSERDQSVEVSGQTFNFKQGETVHTENSRKFEIGALQKLIAQCGWELADSWVDKDSYFSVLLFKAI